MVKTNMGNIFVEKTPLQGRHFVGGAWRMFLGGGMFVVLCALPVQAEIKTTVKTGPQLDHLDWTIGSNPSFILSELIFEALRESEWVFFRPRPLGNGYAA